jgi:hypothetical protein
MKIDIASREQLNAFLNELAAVNKSNEHEDKAQQNEAVRYFLQKFDRKTREQLIGRAYIDALKSPHQKLGTAKPPSDDSNGGRKKKPTNNRKRSAD